MNENEIFLRQMLENQYNSDDVDKILKGYRSNRCVTARINTIKDSVQNIKNELEHEGVIFEEVPWADIALIIKNKNESDLQNMQLYKEGKIYLQSLSSMLPPIIMQPQPGEDILDMAAAPGGKTTEISALTQNQANITACELNPIRAERLRYNVEKQGATSVFVMQKDARNIDDFFSFDRILLDAPCSGSGTLNLNDEKCFNYFSKKLVEKSSKSQMALLKKAVKVLKPGKELIYSTCSILASENEDVVNSILKNEKIEIVPINFDGMEHLPLLPTKIPGTLCVCPNELYEGFFIAKIMLRS